MTAPVIRRWAATVARGEVGGRVATFRDRVLPGMRSVDGFHGPSFPVRRDQDPAPVIVLTKWRAMAAIIALAAARAARRVLVDLMARFFKTHDAEATSCERVLLEEGNV